MRVFVDTSALLAILDEDTQGFPSSYRRRRRRAGEATARRAAPFSAGEDNPSDLVSIAEIAARSARPVNTVQSWRRRHDDFPAPLASLATGPVWMWPIVERWINSRGGPRRRAFTS